MIVSKLSGKPFPNGEKFDVIVDIDCNNPNCPEIKSGEWILTKSGAYMMWGQLGFHENIP